MAEGGRPARQKYKRARTMKVIIGIDVGGSTTKIVGYWQDRRLLGVQRVVAQDPVTSVYGALGRFISENGLQLEQVEHIVLTGVGASRFAGDLYGIPTTRALEFEAIGAGGLELSGCPAALVVSLGTGTAFVEASREGGSRHIGGSGVGGGTIVGLCGLLAQANSFDTIVQLAGRGDLHKVDLTIGDISASEVGNMNKDVTAANFGKREDDAAPEDLVSGVLNMVFQTIGMLSVFACRNSRLQDVVLTGTLTAMPEARPVFDALEALHPTRFLIPENAVFATAIGAALLYLDK